MWGKMLGKQRYKFGLATLAFAVFFMGMTAPTAYAQNAFDTTDTGRIFRQFKNLPDIFRREKPVARPKIETPPSLAIDAPAGAENIFFYLQEIRIDGNVTVYQKGDFLPFYIKKIGTRVSLLDVYQIAAQITNKYHADGYVLSRVVIPEQEINQERGSITIRVTEGYVRRAEITGEKRKSDLLRDFARGIEAMRPFNMKTLEKQLLFLNGLGSADIQAVFKPSQIPNPPEGAIDMSVVVKQQHVKGFVSLDNQGSKYHGPLQAAFHAEVGSLALAHSKITIDAITSLPTDELNLVSVGVKTPLNSEGLTLETDLGYTNSFPGKELEETDVQSSTLYGGIGISYPFLLTREEKLVGRAVFNLNNSKTESLGARLNKDATRALRLQAEYEGMDKSGGYNSTSATLSQGLDILGSRKTGSDDLSRADGHSDFTKVEMTASRLQPVLGSHQLLAQMSGQYAFSELLSSEEFGFGGQAFGRAYDSSEIVGDHGVAALVEFRYGGLPSYADGRLQLQPYAFYDIGKVWNIGNANSYQESAASAGGGLRLDYAQSLSGEISMAQPLTHDADSRPYGSAQDPRFFVKISKKF